MNPRLKHMLDYLQEYSLENKQFIPDEKVSKRMIFKELKDHPYDPNNQHLMHDILLQLDS